MNRREFTGALGMSVAASALTTLPPAAAAATPGVSEQAHRLYAASLVLDANVSPPLETLPLAQAQLDLVRHSGLTVVKASLGGINDNFAQTVESIAQVQRLIELHPQYFMQVRTAADMLRAKQENKLGIILSFESTDMLDGKLSSFELFRNFGVRVMQLSYNRKSPFAAGVMEPSGGGLTPLGREAVHEMNRLGIAIDLSHANPPTTSDVLQLSKLPPVMTHASCAAVYAHPRAKSDEQLRALAQRGGVVGIFDLPYLSASPHQPTVDDYMAHLEHALKVAGEDHVGIGSDQGIEPFDTSPQGMAEFAKETARRKAAGLAAPGEDRPTYVVGLNVPNRIEVITEQLLKRGYSAALTEKIIGKNFARVFTQIWSV
jgi:membrane dipeptidase